MLEIGVQSRGIIRESVIEEGYKKIKQAGITCVDYNIVSPEDSTEKLDINYFKKHRECAERYGLRFSQVHAPIFKYDPNRQDKMEYILEEMKKSIAICNLLRKPLFGNASVRTGICAGEGGGEKNKSGVF